jgi:CHAT domain-containing protein
LPESGREAEEVTRLYAHATALHGASFAAFAAAAPRADVVHVTGHTAREQGGGGAALVFASGERVSWQTLAGCRFAPHAVVVLAACETLSPSSAHALSLGEGALAAGASSVIGTLTPIPDRDARAIFGAVHRHLAEGSGAAEAVRLAQLDTRGDGGSWRSVAVMTTRIP